TRVEHVRVRTAATQRIRWRVSGSLQRLGGEPDRRIAFTEAVTPEARSDFGLDLAVRETGGECGALEHLARQVDGLRLVVRAHLCREGAPLRDDVSRGAARDDSHVCARLLVDTAETEVGDRPRRSGDGRAAVLRVHAGVRGGAVEAKVEESGMRRAE